MPSMVLVGTDAQLWLDTLERVNQRLERALSAVEEGEWDWAPDEGITTIREHLWAIVKSERNLSQVVLRGEAQRTDYEAGQVAFEEIQRMHQICSKNTKSWFETLEEEALEGEVQKACLRHLDLQAHHTAAISLLCQLIDPRRLPALLRE